MSTDFSQSAFDFSHKLLNQKYENDLALERDLRQKVREYETLGKNLTEISKHSTSEAIVKAHFIIFDRFPSATWVSSGGNSSTQMKC